MKNWIKTKRDGYINLNHVAQIKVMACNIYANVNNNWVAIAECVDDDTGVVALDELMEDFIGKKTIGDGLNYDYENMD